MEGWSVVTCAADVRAGSFICAAIVAQQTSSCSLVLAKNSMRRFRFLQVGKIVIGRGRGNDPMPSLRLVQQVVSSTLVL